MAKFKGPKPAAQPRSLRSIAETNSGDFPDDLAPDASKYVDVAEQARPENVRQPVTSNSPLANMKRS